MCICIHATSIQYNQLDCPPSLYFFSTLWETAAPTTSRTLCLTPSLRLASARYPQHYEQPSLLAESRGGFQKVSDHIYRYEQERPLRARLEIEKIRHLYAYKTETFL